MIDWKIKRSNQQPIGLDIGHRFVRMVQLAVRDNRVVVLDAAKTRISSEVCNDQQGRNDFIVSVINQMLSSGKFCGREVISCLPNSELKITNLRMSDSEKMSLDSFLRKEASQRFGLDPGTDSIDYLVAGDVKQGDQVKNEFILLGTKNEIIKKHIEMLEEAKLCPVSLDVVPCALFRSFERLFRRQEDKEHTAVFVDLGSRNTTVVFVRGNEISFIKIIPIGMEQFNEEIAGKVGVSMDEAELLRSKLAINRKNIGKARKNKTEVDLDSATQQLMLDMINARGALLAKEISMCFRYYMVTFRGKRIERAFFAGGGAYDTILLEILKQELPVDIEISQPLRGFDISACNFDESNEESLCDWSVAVGLGLKGWGALPIESEQVETADSTVQAG